jgi:hypothetical protein
LPDVMGEPEEKSARNSYRQGSGRSGSDYGSWGALSFSRGCGADQDGSASVREGSALPAAALGRGPLRGAAMPSVAAGDRHGAVLHEAFLECLAAHKHRILYAAWAVGTRLQGACHPLDGKPPPHTHHHHDTHVHTSITFLRRYLCFAAPGPFCGWAHDSAAV